MRDLPPIQPAQVQEIRKLHSQLMHQNEQVQAHARDWFNGIAHSVLQDAHTSQLTIKSGRELVEVWRCIEMIERHTDATRLTLERNNIPLPPAVIAYARLASLARLSLGRITEEYYAGLLDESDEARRRGDAEGG